MSFCFDPAAAKLAEFQVPLRLRSPNCAGFMPGLGLMKCKTQANAHRRHIHFPLLGSPIVIGEPSPLAVSQAVLEPALSGCVLNRMFCKPHPVFAAATLDLLLFFSLIRFTLRRRRNNREGDCCPSSSRRPAPVPSSAPRILVCSANRARSEESLIHISHLIL